MSLIFRFSPASPGVSVLGKIRLLGGKSLVRCPPTTWGRPITVYTTAREGVLLKRSRKDPIDLVIVQNEEISFPYLYFKPGRMWALDPIHASIAGPKKSFEFQRRKILFLKKKSPCDKRT